MYKPEILSENILGSISIIMKKIAEKILFPVFMSNIIEYQQFAICRSSGKINEPRHTGNMSHNMETLFKFLCQEPRCGKLTEPRHMENC